MKLTKIEIRHTCILLKKNNKQILNFLKNKQKNYILFNLCVLWLLYIKKNKLLIAQQNIPLNLSLLNVRKKTPFSYDLFFFPLHQCTNPILEVLKKVGALLRLFFLEVFCKPLFVEACRR